MPRRRILTRRFRARKPESPLWRWPLFPFHDRPPRATPDFPSKEARVRAPRPAVSALVVALPVLVGVLASGCAAQSSPPAVPRDARTGCFTFENCAPGTPGGWGGGPASTLSIDTTRSPGGRASGLIARSEDEPESPFSSFTMSLPVDFSGKELELRGWLRLENVKGYAGLWQRQDGVSGSGSVQFDNMQRRNLHGTIDWAEYKVTLPLDPRA